MKQFGYGILVGITVTLSIVGIGHALTRKAESVPIPADYTPAPEQRQLDGSLVLERKPNADAKPAQMLPDTGAKVERVVQVVVQPDPIEIPKAALAVEGDTITYSLPPITVDFTLLRQKDGGARVVASSPDGMLLSGIDVPVNVQAIRQYKNAAGGSWGPDSYGAWYHRGLGRRWIVGAAVRSWQPRVADRREWSFEIQGGFRW